jgi:DNA invertase Pin-like site-specific DNA recombinase
MPRPILTRPPDTLAQLDAGSSGHTVTRQAARAIGYVRLSKAEEGHGLSVQRRAIEDYCGRRGLELLRVEEDNGASGRSTRKRPGLAAALEACRSEECGAVVATRVDRLARSSLDFHRIVEATTRAGATVLFSEQESFSLDTPEGRMLAGILASFAAFEGDLISARTKAALAVVRANGSRSGRRIGNPSFARVPPEIESHIVDLRRHGLSYRRIAEMLNEQLIPTAQGGKAWHSQTISNVVRRSS